jgi:PAS domain S-box-containing protein
LPPQNDIQRLLFTLLEFMGDACVVLDRDWRYLFVNRKAGQILGREPQGLLGKHIWTEFPEGVDQPFHRTYEAAMAERKFVQLEAYYPPWDRWFENRIHPCGDGLAIFFNDVTDRRRAYEAAFRDAEARAQAERMAHLGFWQWDVAVNQVTWSEELYRIYGLDPAGFPASFEAYLERVHPDDRVRVRETVRAALETQQPFRFEERVVRPNGQVRHLHSWGSISTDPHGKVALLFGTCLDMTLLVETTEGLRRSEWWLDVALEASGVALWDWDLRSGQLSWSRGVDALFGIAKGTLGRTMKDLLAVVHSDDRDRVLSALSAAVRSGEDFTLEYRVVTPAGEARTIEDRGRSFRGADGKLSRMAGSLLDVTEQRRAAEELKRVESKLRAAQKMDAIGRLAAGVAHDFNNLLTVIVSSAWMLDEKGTPAELRTAVNDITGASARAAKLTRGLLAMSRQQELTLAVHDVDALISEMASLLARLLPPTIALRTEPGSAGYVVGDRSQLEQVILNLAVNARDAMPAGGPLTVATRAVGAWIAIEVRDEGVGMPLEVQARIFEPYFTTKPEGQGTGLGLAMVYGIVTQSGGRIEVSSVPGAGTTFTVLLPRAKAPEKAALATAAVRPTGRGTGRVVLAEDDRPLRTVLHAALEQSGYRVTSTSSPTQALDALAAGADVLITDVQLPEMSGIELARRATRLWPRLKVVFMSGAGGAGSTEPPPAPLLEKPFTPAALVDRIRQVLDEV